MESQNFKVLIVEDDQEIATILIAYLENHGYKVAHAVDGIMALVLINRWKPDFVILDINIPKKDGLQVLLEIRSMYDMPVMMLTAMDSDIDKLYALKSGADDFMVKPFNPAEVVTRVNIILQRYQKNVSNNAISVYKTNSIELNVLTHQVFIGPAHSDISSFLTCTEFKILHFLIKEPERVFTRKEIMEECLAVGNFSERTVDSHVSNLRKKIEKAGVNFIPESVRGLGYRLGQ